MPPASPIQKRLYGCGVYNNYCNGSDGGLSYGGRVGIVSHSMRQARTDISPF